MSEGYVLLAGILLYVVVFRLLMTTTLRPFVAALLAIGPYFLLSTVLKAYMFAAYDAPISQLFEFRSLLIVALQFAMAWFAYYKVDVADEQYTEAIVWGALGCIGVFFAIPMMLAMLL
jgi:hypothetical protein